eukprot:gene2165-8025_t
MKLNADLILMAPQFTNPLKQREIDLRGFLTRVMNAMVGGKIQVIENLGATLDQFDAIDLSDNDIRSLDGFPLLKRLSALLLSNNRILLSAYDIIIGHLSFYFCYQQLTQEDFRRIAPNLCEMLPNLEAVVLTNNNLSELSDLEPLFRCKNINHLTLLRNPVTAKENYRLFVVFHMPSLKVLDFNRVRKEERELASKLYSSSDGQQILTQILSTSTKHEAEVVLAEQEKRRKEETSKTREDAIAKASSLEEIQQLEAQLQAGVVPGEAEASENQNTPSSMQE